MAPIPIDDIRACLEGCSLRRAAGSDSSAHTFSMGVYRLLNLLLVAYERHLRLHIVVH